MKPLLITLWLVLVLVEPALADSHKGEWNILVVTEGGTVSLLKNLTEDVARQTMQRLTPYWRRPDFKFPEGGFSHMVDKSDINTLEAFGPEGKELVVWPKKSEVKP